MRVVVGEGAQPVELFLAGCVPEGELDVDVVDKDVCAGSACVSCEGGSCGAEVSYTVHVVLEDGRLVDGWEIAARIVRLRIE